jgi:hypothetical protein
MSLVADLSAQARRINLRHVAVAIVLGYAAKAGLEMRPDLIYDQTGKNIISPSATPLNIGFAVGLLSFYAMHSGKMEGSSGGGMQTFYTVETMPGAMGGHF